MPASRPRVAGQRVPRRPAPNNATLGLPEGDDVACTGNTIVWLGKGPFPDAHSWRSRCPDTRVVTTASTWTPRGRRVDLDPKRITMTTSNRLRNLLALVLERGAHRRWVRDRSAQGLISTTQLELKLLNDLIRTSPFGGLPRRRCATRSGHVVRRRRRRAGDGLRQRRRPLPEVDRTTGAERRKLAESAFVNPRPAKASARPPARPGRRTSRHR